MKNLRLQDLTIEQKIGMVLTARNIRSDEDREFIYEMIKKKALGAIQVPINDKTKEEIAKIKEIADYPILICNDMEKGFPIGKAQFPSALSIASLDNVEYAYQIGATTAIEAKSYGYNMVWGPVVDIDGGRTLCSTGRMFGDTPEKVSRIANAIVKGYMDNGMMCTIKHYPGLGGNAYMDTHMAEGFSPETEEDLKNYNLKPYISAMENTDCYGVMVGHQKMPNIDPDYPASISKKILGVLRNAGFDGLIVTDSFAMMGILQKYKEENLYGLALSAGNDMILPNYRVDFKVSYNYLLENFKSGMFPISRLDEAVSRVLKAQELASKEPTAKALSERQIEIIKEIGKNGICVKADEGVSLQLPKDKKRLFVVLKENKYEFEGAEIAEITDNGYINDENISIVKDAIKSKFPNDEIIEITQFPHLREIDKVCYTSTFFEEVVFVTYGRAGCYCATDSLTEKIRNLILALGDKVSTIVHFGTPYAMEDVTHIPRLILNFGLQFDAVKYSFEILNGEYVPDSKLPINLNLK